MIDTGVGGSAPLPELASVYWRSLADEDSLRRAARLWTIVTASHTVPFVAVAVLLILLAPVTAPVALILLLHAWIIPELYAARGANVLRARVSSPDGAERIARGLLGDLLDRRADAVHEQTGLVIERGYLGVWMVGEAGAVLIRPGGRRVHCFCVKATDQSLPASDRVAHLLLALREHEAGFATVANLAFCGARWRLHRRLARNAQRALEIAASAARSEEPRKP
ncbi:MAG: hypothetical protein WBP81_22735 [Solirubrobacteraceae bacterium]